MTDQTVTRSAPAKANLMLRVLGRDAGTGYHALETVFCLLNLADDLSATRSESGVSLDLDGPDLGPPDQNLAVRAAELVLAAMGHPFGVHLTLTKRIPARAGLGGGSSDAAAALEAVNQLGGNAVPRAELLQMATRLGSDVPFFISGARLALAWGRGERLLRLPALPARPVLLAIPTDGVETAEAYGWWDDAHPEGLTRGAVVLDAEVLGSWGDVARLGGNDFERLLFGRRPALGELFERLAGTGPLLCRLSGTGSALLAVYRTPQQRDEAALQIGGQLATLVKTDTQS